ncbi:MAG: disaggregatase related repeat-containing protein [Methanosarcina sp.]
MQKSELGALFLAICLILTTVPAVLGNPGSKVVYVAGDGSGDFNCDGSDDHIEINQALGAAAENPESTTVYLKGPFTYIIDDTLLIGSNTILKGDPDAKVKLVSQAGWTEWKPLIKERASGAHDITIQGFTLDGNREENKKEEENSGYYNLIHLSNCQNINVQNMHLVNSQGYGLKADDCANIKFQGNEASLLDHETVYASSCSGIEISDNKITCKTNSALKIYNTNKAKLHDNIITSEGSYGSGIEIQKCGTASMNEIKVYNNIIYKMPDAGIWIFGSGNYHPSSAKIYIHHNQIYNTGTEFHNKTAGGIISEGFSGIIENNVIDGVYGHGISQKNIYTSSPLNSGYTLILKNNIISYTKNGSGVQNSLTDTHYFSLENNCFYENEEGDYKGVQGSSSDVNADPQYLDRENKNYRLKSTSPVTGMGVFSNTTFSSEVNSSDLVKESLQDNKDVQNETKIAEKESLSTKDSEFVENNIEINITEDINGSALTSENKQSTNGGILGESALVNASTGTENALSSGKITQISCLKDNRIKDSTPDTIYKDKEYLDIGGSGSEIYRDFLIFDLSKYNTSTKINSSTLSLYWYYPDGVERPEDTIIEVYRPAESWNSDYLTWNNKDRNLAWTQPGGDWYDKNGVLQGDTPYATITLKGIDIADYRYYELDVTELVQEYASGEYENTGFLIKTTYENSDYVAFCSSDNLNKNQHPKLIVEGLTA